MTGQSRQGSSRPRKVLAWITIVLAALLVAYLLLSTVASRGKYRTAVRDADEGAAVAVPAGRAWAEAVSAALSASLGQPIGHEEHLRCGTDQSYGSWIVEDHYHSCHLLHVQIYLSPDGPDAAADAVAGEELDHLLESVVPHEGDDCSWLRRSRWEPGIPDTRVMFQRMGDRTGPLPCPSATRLLLPLGHVDRAERISGDLDLEAVGQGDVVVVSWRTKVSSTSLGCSPFSVIFCFEPWWTDAHLPDEVR